MKEDKNTCWYKYECVESMRKAAMSHEKLELTSHGLVLYKLIQMIYNEKFNFLDIGCGNGMTGDLIISGNYTGLDMKHIIENLSMINRKYAYICCDLINDDISFINKYDVIIMNAFIDVMEYPLQVLEKILFNSNKVKYIIIHRQRVTEQQTSVIKNYSYDGYTYCSILNMIELTNLYKKYNFNMIFESPSGLSIHNDKSFILKNNDLI